MNHPSNGPAQPGPEFLVIGRVLRPHGVRGDLRIQALTAFPDRMKYLKLAYFGPKPDDVASLDAFDVTRMRHEKADFWLMHLDGIDSRDDAEPFRSNYVLIPIEDAVPLEEDEIYLYQVLGLAVETVSGEQLGTVVDIIETGANDVYVVKGDIYGEILIPAIEDVIVEISPETGLMRIDPMPGLLPE